MPANPPNLIAATIVGPIAGAFLFSAGLRAMSFPLNAPTTVVLEVVAMTFTLGVGFGIPAMLVVGLPTHSMLMRANKRSLFSYMLAGTIVGGLVGGAFLLSAALYGIATASTHANASQISTSDIFVVLLISAPMGCFSAAFFWLLRRPDRDAPNPAASAP